MDMITNKIIVAALVATLPMLSAGNAFAHKDALRKPEHNAYARYSYHVPNVARHHYRQFRVAAFKRGCVAVAKRGGGYGTRIHRTRRVGTAHRMRRACRRALRKCDIALDRRQAHGLNPFAACVVVRRIPRF